MKTKKSQQSRRRLLALVLSCLSFVATLPSAASAHDGVEASRVVHNHQYNCEGQANTNSFCLDPTTGFGPVLYMYLGTSLFKTWGNVNICMNGGGDSQSSDRQRWYDGDTFMSYGPGNSTIAISDGTLAGGCTDRAGSMWASHAVYSEIRVYANYYAVWFASVRH